MPGLNKSRSAMSHSEGVKTRCCWWHGRVTNPSRQPSKMEIMKKSLLIKTLLVAAGLPLLAGCIVERQPRRVVVVQQPPPSGEVIVENPGAPPPPLADVQPPAPDPTFVWIGGYYDYGPRGWVWIGGHWDRPHPGARWMAGHWERRGRGSVWIGAGWR